MDGLVFYYDEKVIRLGPIQVFVCGLVERKKTTSHLPTYLPIVGGLVGPLYARWLGKGKKCFGTYLPRYLHILCSLVR